MVSPTGLFQPTGWLATSTAGSPPYTTPAAGVNAVNELVCGEGRPAAYSVTVNTADSLPSGIPTRANRANYESQCVTLGDSCIITVETDDCFLSRPLYEDVGSTFSSVVHPAVVGSLSGAVSFVSALPCCLGYVESRTTDYQWFTN